MRRKDRELTDIRTIESIIERSDVCRLAFSDNDIPYIVTLNFGYSVGDKSLIYFHCANSGRKMDMLRKNNYVCFEMDTDHRISGGDRGCDWGMEYSSIVGYGYIYIVADESERLRGLNLIMRHYGGENHSGYDPGVLKETTILRLEIISLTAKRKSGND